MVQENRPRYHAARRLVRVVSDLQDAYSSVPREATLLEIIACASGLDAGNPAVLGRAKEIFELPREVVQLLRDVDEPDARPVRLGVAEVVRLLSAANLLRAWEPLAAELSQHSVVLTSASMMLDCFVDEVRLDEARLQELANQIRVLLEEIRRDHRDQDAEIFRYVEQTLVSLLQDIDSYWINGAANIEATIDRAVGHVARGDGSMLQSPTVKRVGKILSSVALVVALAHNMGELPQTIENLFELSSRVQTIGGLGQDEPRISLPQLPAADSPSEKPPGESTQGGV